jgi:TatA/E family protein of Tat protein translocase
MHVGDTIFIFCLALIIFGPKKLPEIGRQIGKLMVEFRRASNEFKMQIEEELRASEESERQKEITAAATTTAPIAASSLLAGMQTAESNGLPNQTIAPVIAPPSTGLPVNHTFPSTEPAISEPSPAVEVADAYPEPADGFNPGLNTASNSESAEVPVAERFPTERFEPSPLDANGLETIIEGPESEKAQAPVHHG